LKRSTLYYLKNSKILTNLLIMMFIWLATSLSYYLSMFLLNNFKHQVYMSGFLGAIGDQIAVVISGYVFHKIGLRLSVSILFSMTCIGGIGMLAFGLQH